MNILKSQKSLAADPSGAGEQTPNGFRLSAAASLDSDPWLPYLRPALALEGPVC